MSMYFIPQRDAWYRSFAHISPLVRYIGTIGLFTLFLGGWMLGLYPFMDALIMQDRAQYVQLEQQATKVAQTQKECSGMSCTMKKLNETLLEYTAKCSGEFCTTQLTMLIDQAAKSGIQITSYTNQKEIRKSWCTCHDVQIAFAASLDATVSFLEKISQSNAMIECNQIVSHCAQNGLFHTTCSLRFISL